MSIEENQYSSGFIVCAAAALRGGGAEFQKLYGVTRRGFRALRVCDSFVREDSRRAGVGGLAKGSFPRKSTAFCKMRQDGQPRSAVLDAMIRAGAARMGGMPLLKHEERLVIGDTEP